MIKALWQKFLRWLRPEKSGSVVFANNLREAMNAPSVPRIGEIDFVRHLRVIAIKVSQIEGTSFYRINVEFEHVPHFVMNSCMQVRDLHQSDVCRLARYEEYRW